MATKVKKLDFYKKSEDIFEKYKDENMAIFLDSSLENAMGQYSVIGLNPYLILKECDGIFYENDVPQEITFEEGMQKYLEKQKEENPTSLPLIAGALGYFSYDYGRKFEQISSRHPKKLSVPDALFVFYDLLIIDDKIEKALYITARGKTKNQDVAITDLEQEIKECASYKRPKKHSALAPFTPNFTKEDYKKAIDKMISYIIEGDIYIANMTQQLTIESQKPPYEVYRYLRTHNPSPFGGFFQCNTFQVVCASPERFLKVKNRCIETRPIKGTRKRGENPVEDKILKEELKNSSKDRSELLMIVDLERNDLNHVCEAGSVKVTEHFAVETYSTVFHIHLDNQYHLGVGGGITCESDLEFEYEETLQKAKALLEALWEEK